MRDKDYRLPAHPKSTIREKQGSHRDLSVCKLDFTRTERAIFARTTERKNRRIKEAMDAWECRSCDKEKCSAVIESIYTFKSCARVRAMFLAVDMHRNASLED